MLIIGVLLLAAKMAEIGPTADWPWWIVLAPFGIAVLWWHFADTSGLTQKRAMNKMEERKIQRRERSMEALGLSTQRERQVTRARQDVARRNSADTKKLAPAPEPPRADPTMRDESHL
jgi:small Trp-rich protein